MRARALAVFVVAGLFVSPAAKAERLDQRCEDKNAVAPYASFTESQAFTPSVEAITSFDVNLGYFQTWSGRIRAGISMHLPTEGLSGSAGVVDLGEAVAEVSGRARTARWAHFVLPKPADVNSPLPGSWYTLDVTFPVVFANGVFTGPVGWMICQTGYDGGRAYETFGLRAVTYFAIAIAGLPIDPATVGVQPSVMVVSPGGQFQFRTFGV